jgi:hypothetical protein
VDKGEVDKKKVVQKRELYGESDDSGSLSEESDLWDNTLNDGLDDELTEYDTILNGLDYFKTDVADTEEDVVDDISLDLDGDGIITDEERAADLDGDGEVSEEEEKQWYESGGWRQPIDGKDYWHHPWFDWKKTDRWVNNTKAVSYWIKHRGGTSTQLDNIKSNKYPTDFNSKTY